MPRTATVAQTLAHGCAERHFDHHAVYVCTDLGRRDLLVPAGGFVYRVQPLSEVWPDPQSGYWLGAWCCEAARVLGPLP